MGFSCAGRCRLAKAWQAGRSVSPHPGPLPREGKNSRLLTIGAILAFALGAFAQTATEISTNAPSLRAVATPAKPAATPSEKPLLLGDEKPLLLDDEPSTNAPTGTMADNSRCLVCHVNFTMEKLTMVHARTNIGCASCHGVSDAHIADESWASGGNGTAPEIMFTRFKIAKACMECHKPEQVFLKNEKHKPIWWTIAYQTKVCTECHGSHRMVKRRCQWKEPPPPLEN